MENEKYTMIYKIKHNYGCIRILGKRFVRNNKNKGKIIYKNKKYPLKTLFKFKDIIKNKSKIQILINKDCCNKSFMFKDCISLTEIKIENNSENILFNDKNSLYIERRNNLNKHEYNNLFDYLNNNSQNKLYNCSKWNIKISAMNEIFSNCLLLKKIPDISKWNTSNLIDMNKMFYNCRNLSLIPDISKWNTSNVIDMNRMFYNCATLTSLPDLSKWNTKNVINIVEMFYNCLSLSSIPDISKKNLKNTNMNSLLEKSYSIFKLIYEIQNETLINIFDSDFVKNNKKNCKMIIDNKIYLLSDKYYISDDNRKFLKIKLMIINDKRINLSYMLYNCKSLKKFYRIPKEENNFNSDNEIKKEIKDGKIETNHKFDLNGTHNNLSYNFYHFNDTKKEFNETFINKNKPTNYSNKLNLIYIHSDNKNKISDEDEEKMNEIILKSNNFLSPLSPFYLFDFRNKNINENSSINHYQFPTTESEITKRKENTNENISLYENFYPTKQPLDYSYEKNNIIPTDLSYMFYGCSSLISISGISKWNTSYVTKISHMFQKCISLKNIDDISQWKFKKLIDISTLI